MPQGKEGGKGRGGLLNVLLGFVERPRNQERRQSGLGRGGGDGGLGERGRKGTGHGDVYTIPVGCIAG